VHDGGAVISHPVVVASFAGGVLVPCAGSSRHIVPVDADVLVPVLPLLGVHNSQDMHQFVKNSALPVASGAVGQLVGALEGHFPETLHSHSRGEAPGGAGRGAHADLEMVLPGLATVLFEPQAGPLLNLLHCSVENTLVVAGHTPFPEVRNPSILPFEGVAGVHCPEMAPVRGE